MTAFQEYRSGGVADEARVEDLAGITASVSRSSLESSTARSTSASSAIARVTGYPDAVQQHGCADCGDYSIASVVAQILMIGHRRRRHTVCARPRMVYAWTSVPKPGAMRPSYQRRVAKRAVSCIQSGPAAISANCLV